MGECCTHCSECDRKKVRDEKEYKDLIHRLSRIEGQVRGIREMVESDRYCVDILTQVSAIQSALNSFNKVLLSQPHQILRCGGYPAGKRRRRG